MQRCWFDNIKLKQINYKQKLDDADYDKIVAEKEVEKLMQGNPVHTKELNKRAEWKQLVNHYEASKLKNERLSKKLSIYKDLFYQHFEDTKIREVNSILAELDAKEYIELFSGDLTEGEIKNTSVSVVNNDEFYA